ncbi:MAG: hypothetical protein C5B50_28935 [Verrucomicrobia bacterium]|nr:MAG: hypothetical protein C5B50_28935 [Verrucomicrobiota bacterium]
MQSDNEILRPKAGVRVLFVALYLAGSLLIWVHLPFGIPDRLKDWIAPIYNVLGLLCLTDLFLERIVLGSDSVRIVTGFRSQTIPRADIDGVTWAAGCGASFILRGGKSVRLPSVGRAPQGLTNTIRAWLKRTEAGW